MKFKSGQIAGAMALTLLMTGAVGTTAFAASVDTSVPPAQTQSAETENENKPDAATLAAQAKITEAEAIAIAEKANPDYTFTLDELDSENGVALYDLKGIDQNESQVKIEVNALDGTVVADSEQDVQNESDNDTDDDKDEGNSKSEKDTEDPSLEAQEQADLAAQAKLTEADAIATAEAANSGYTFTADGLDSENGIAVYDLKGTDAAGETLQVKISAADGTVVTEADGEYEG